MTNILIVGYGEIGKSIHGLYKDKSIYEISILDKNTDSSIIPIDIDIMHICFPYTKEFTKQTIAYLEKFSPKLTIIHSTIPILTTRIIVDNTKAKVVHSPVMGKHPNLTKSIKTFRKIVASYDKSALQTAITHFANLEIKTVIYNSPEESEIAKMLSTTRYGWDIYFMQRVHDLCEEYNLDFDNVYKQTTAIYNNGYEEMGEAKFKRPILKYMGKGAGGHCIRPNAEILYDSTMLEEIAELVISLGKKKE